MAGFFCLPSVSCVPKAAAYDHYLGVRLERWIQLTETNVVPAFETVKVISRRYCYNSAIRYSKKSDE